MDEVLNGGGILGSAYDNVIEAYGIEPGKMQVFREFVPRNNTIEYTVYFRKDGTKYRLDFDEPVDRVKSLGSPAEWILMGRVLQQILDGNYKLATAYVS